MIKKITAVLFAMVLIPLCACHMVVYDEEADRLQVVAVVNGEEIQKDTIIDDYEAYKSYAYIDEDSENTEYGKNVARNLKKGFLEDMIEDRILKLKFEDYNIAELSAEEMDELQEKVDAYVESLESVILVEMDNIRPSYPDETEEKIHDLAKFNVLQKYGVADGSYLDELVTDRRKEMLLDVATDGNVLTDEDLKAWYDENLKKQQEDTKTMAQYSANIASGIALYVPKDRYFVRAVCIDYYNGIMSEVKELRGTGKKDEAEAMMEKARAEAEAKANEALEKLNAGEDFAIVALEYSTDKFSKEEPYITEGFETFAGMKTRPSEWITAALSLEKEGDISDVVYYEDNAYYIFQLVKIVPSGDIAFEDVKDDIYDMLYNEARDKAYAELMEAWKKEYKVEYYIDRL